MKRRLLVLLVFYSLIAQASTERYYYVRPSFGCNYISYQNVPVTFERGHYMSGGVGMFLPDSERCRLELECAYRSNKVKNIKIKDCVLTTKGTVGNLLVGGNFLVDIPHNQYFRPYIGLGIGRVFSKQASKCEYRYRMEDQVFKFSPKKVSTGYQAVIGLKMRVFDSIEYLMEYKYLNCPRTHGNNSVSFGFSHYF